MTTEQTLRSMLHVRDDEQECICAECRALQEVLSKKAEAGAVAACPFCGAYQWWIECTECGAGSPASAPMDEARAIAAWNRRTPAAVPVEALEGVVREMQQVKTATGRRSPTADHCANLLLALIKERSNG